MIKPSIGRVVWFQPAIAPEQPHPDQPFAALITYVWGDRLINLVFFEHDGEQRKATSVPLLQDGDTPDPRGFYAEWMPYQKGQAAKTKQLEEKLETRIEGAVTMGLVNPAHDFGFALLMLKQGHRVARAGWNGRGMFAYLVPAASYPVQTGAAKAHFGEGSMVPYNAYMALKGVDNAVSTWVPSVSDCLAEDWSVVE